MRRTFDAMVHAPVSQPGSKARKQWYSNANPRRLRSNEICLAPNCKKSALLGSGHIANAYCAKHTDFGVSDVN